MRYMMPLIACLAATPVYAQSVQKENCFSPHVEVTANNLAETLQQSATIEAQLRLVTNQDVVVSGFELSYELWSDKRPLPLSKSLYTDMQTIEGGLLSNEVLNFAIPVTLTDRGMGFVQDAEQLTVRFAMISMTDDNGEEGRCEW